MGTRPLSWYYTPHIQLNLNNMTAEERIAAINALIKIIELNFDSNIRQKAITKLEELIDQLWRQ